MELLQAVNTVLPYLTEHPITRIEGTDHPTVDLILAAIDRQRLTVLGEGLWFNNENRTLNVEVDGRIKTPKDTIAIYGKDRMVTVEGAYIYDVTNGTRYFTGAIDVELVLDKEFNKLPMYAALTITYAAAVEVYLQDYGNESVVGQLQALSNTNANLLRMEHERNTKRNALTNRGMQWRVRFR